MSSCSRRRLPPPILSPTSCWSVFAAVSQPRLLVLQSAQVIICKPHRVLQSCRLSDLNQPYVDISPSNPCHVILHTGTRTDLFFLSASDCCDFTAQLLAQIISPGSAAALTPAVAAPSPPPPVPVTAHLGDER